DGEPASRRQDGARARHVLPLHSRNLAGGLGHRDQRAVRGHRSRRQALLRHPGATLRQTMRTGPLELGSLSSQSPLASGDAAAFRRDGFLFPLDVFTPAEAADWAAEVAALPTPALQAHPAPWVQKAYLLLPSLDRLVRDPRLTDRVAAIL